MNPKIFPTILIVIDVLAAIVYATKLDLRMTVYWISAALISFSVTWL